MDELRLKKRRSHNQGFLDRGDDCSWIEPVTGVFAPANAGCWGSYGVVWMYLVTEKCPSPTLLLPRSLVLAAVLVVVTGARVALAPSHGDADRRPCGRHHDVDTDRPRECGCWPCDLQLQAVPRHYLLWKTPPLTSVRKGRLTVRPQPLSKETT